MPPDPQGVKKPKVFANLPGAFDLAYRFAARQLLSSRLPGGAGQYHDAILHDWPREQ
jgi:hypothetical protein